MFPQLGKLSGDPCMKLFKSDEKICIKTCGNVARYHGNTTVPIRVFPGGLFPLFFSSPAFCPCLMNGVHTAHECSQLALLILPVPFSPLCLFQSLSSELTHKVSSGYHPYFNYPIRSYYSLTLTSVPPSFSFRIKSCRNAVQSC